MASKVDLSEKLVNIAGMLDELADIVNDDWHGWKKQKNLADLLSAVSELLSRDLNDDTATILAAAELIKKRKEKIA